MPTNSSSPSMQRWLLPVLVAVVALTVGGGFLARELYREPVASPPPPVAPTTTAPSEPPPGSRQITVTRDVAAHPEQEEVRALLQLFFDSINDRNYDRWKTTVTTDRLRTKTETDWLKEYRTTQDGNIVVYRIETTSDDDLHVMVGFTSTQDLADAPKDMQSECIRWQLTLPIALENGQWKVDTVPSGSVPEQAVCS